MISDKLTDAINKQINAELHSAYLYLSMAGYFESTNFSGFAHWMRLQFQEEVGHAMKFISYLNERGARLALTTIEGPQTEWKSPLAAFEAAYNHEVTISGKINALVDLAVQEKDHATNAFLQWYVTEQVEEESSADDVVQKLKLIGDRPHGIFLLDRELARRGAG
jgi:ferritin